MLRSSLGRGAFSLAEVLIAASLAGLVSTAVLLLFVLVGRKLIWSEQISDRQMVVLLARRRLLEDLSNSAREGVSSPQPESLLVGVQLRPIEGGERRWRPSPLLWGMQNGLLVRAEKVENPVGQDAPPALLIPLAQALLQWRRTTFPNCALKSVELQPDHVGFVLNFSQRRWDGGWQDMDLPGQARFSL